MAGGYMGKLLSVDLSTGELDGAFPDESLYRNFIGGYGVGVRIPTAVSRRPGIIVFM